MKAKAHTSMFHTVHVLSRLDVAMSCGSTAFQSNEVSGAVRSLRFDCTASEHKRKDTKTSASQKEVYVIQIFCQNGALTSDVPNTKAVA